MKTGSCRPSPTLPASDVPVTVGLVIDTSGSMRPKHREVVTAALSFIAASNRSDEVFVVNFGDRVSSGLPDDVPFTADLGQLRAALWMGSASKAGRLSTTRFCSPCIISRRASARRRPWCWSATAATIAAPIGADEVMRMVRESRATIYTIGIFDEDDPDRNPGLLRRLAQVSGGESYFPETAFRGHRHLPADRKRHSHPVHDRLRSGSIRRAGFAAERLK